MLWYVVVDARWLCGVVEGDSEKGWNREVGSEKWGGWGEEREKGKHSGRKNQARLAT
jgi:hypothetical protein